MARSLEAPADPNPDSTAEAISKTMDATTKAKLQSLLRKLLARLEKDVNHEA